jgi:hypothetical protein
MVARKMVRGTPWISQYQSWKSYNLKIQLFHVTAITKIVLVLFFTESNENSYLIERHNNQADYIIKPCPYLFE